MTKIEQVRVLLAQNREDTQRAESYTPSFRSGVLMQLRVEREQLEHQLLVLTGFKETEAAKLAADLPAPKPRRDDDEGKELVHA